MVPSGFSTEAFAEEQQELPIVTSVSLRLIRRPATPSKRKLPFWPGTEVASEAGAPPGTMSVWTSGGTS